VSAAGRPGVVPGLVARYYLGKPDLAPFLALKHPSLASMAHAAANELAYRLGTRWGHRLTAVNLELTNRCNLACAMCPVGSTMSRPAADMSRATFQRIVDGTPGLEMVLLYQWGESLLLKDFFDRVAYAAARGLRVWVTSNGTLLTDKVCRKIVTSGLERIMISVDGSPAVHQRIRGFPLEQVREGVERLVRLRDQRGALLGIDVNMTVWEENEAEVPGVRADWRHLVDRVQLIPRFTAGRRTAPCRELWRGSLVVQSSGAVVPCCRDTEGELVLGDAATTPLAAIWQGPAMQRLRVRHRRGDFPPPCDRCAEHASPHVSARFS
jgi:sulfatase maturation enzyme AslB (radical SAM superfamily)